MSNNICNAIVGVMNDIGAVGKNDRNKQQNFMYRGIDAVMNALQPALIKNKVFIVPKVLEEQREERQSKKGDTLLYARLKMEYTFFADDGSNISATVIGEAMDSGDKATNKAMSVAYKYACFQVFCIPTMLDDPDAECHEVAPTEAKNEPMNAEDVRVNSNHVATLRAIMKRKGVDESKIIERYGKKNIEDLSMADFMRAMKGLEKSPDILEEGEEVDLGL